MGRTSPLLFAAGRVLILGAAEVFALLLLSMTSVGISLHGWHTAIETVVLVGVFNALFRPVLLIATLPFMVLSLGFLTLLINTVMFHLAAVLLPGIEAGFGASFVAVLVLAMANTLASTLFAFHEEDSIYRYITRRLTRLFRPLPTTPTPGLIFVEIDGLSHPTLERAMRAGYMPAVRRLVRSRSHRLTRWNCGLPSQTSSVQAGVLLGNNFDIPGFRWFDKTAGHMVQCNDPADVAKIEQRVSRGAGLLREGGISICNMFTGDADRSIATLSTLNTAGRLRKSSAAYFPYFLYPYNFPRTLMQIVGEIVIERWQGWRQRLRNELPRVSRGGSFPLLRAASTVFQREIGTYALVSEIFAGAPVAYITYNGYDVVAHHAGPERSDALRILRSVDRRIALLMRAARDAPRDYHFVFLSDHGQTPSVPFRQRHGRGIDAVVRELVSDNRAVHAPVAKTEEWPHLRSLIAEALAYDRLSAQAARRIFRARARRRTPVATPQSGDVLVCASGNLAHIYFTSEPHRLHLADVAGGHPGLIEGLVAHPGIEFVMLLTALHGPVVTGRGGVHYLRDGRVEGEDPLAVYGPHARDLLLRLDEFPHCGDIVLMGRYDPDSGQVETFEEMVGAHGGLGGAQNAPFLLIPGRWPLPNPMASPEELYQVFIHWRDRLDHGKVPPPRVDDRARDVL
ncbi:MAG TPA: phage holin family protein [Candidatus Krumholzibacteria bacterium]|nr:phage holin family protein [Candidatus Krumholzibacteria bacterium]